MYMKIIILGIIASLMPFIYAFCNETTIKSENYKTESYAVRFEISKNCYAAISKEKLDEVTRAAARKDKEAVAKLVLDGYVGILTKGTQVEIVSGGLVVKKVQIISGAYKNLYMYVPSDCIKSSN